MKTKTKEGKTGIRWTFVTKLEDLDFTDVIALLSKGRQDCGCSRKGQTERQWRKMVTATTNKLQKQ